MSPAISRVVAFAWIGLMAGTALGRADTLKIAYVDPLSGGGASVGQVGLEHFQYIADQVNAKGGVLGMKVEILGYDDKTNPQEALVQVQKAIDAGARIIAQGNGSSVGAAIEDFVAKYDDRNPGKEVVYINYAAVDPSLTNAKCSYWHFRWDANSDIKMEALTNYVKTRPSIKKIYLINQDYSFGQSVRTEARKMLAQKRPDIQIVGDELHPLLKVTDFSPYIAKIKASGADTVITGNWGQDIALLLKAAADAGLQADWYTYYAGGAGGPTAIRQANLADRVFAVGEGFANIDYAPARAMETEFRTKLNGQTLWYPRVFNMMDMIFRAIEEAKSADPLKFAPKLEGMKITTFDGGEGFMRAADHQFFQDMFVVALGPLGAGQPFDEEHTGWGWKEVGKVPADQTVLPTTCKMQRPS